MGKTFSFYFAEKQHECSIMELNSPNFTSSQIGNFKMGETFSFYFAEKQHEL
jgi:hypothetical protein